MTTKTDWMDPLNAIIWKSAIRAKKTHVTIRDGREFILRYEKLYDRLDKKDVEKVWISPSRDGINHGNRFSPCGWFDVQGFLAKGGAAEK